MTMTQRTVLVADADPAIRDGMVDALRGAGFSPVPVTEPGQVAALLEAPLPDLVVTDIDIEGFDGLDLATAFRARAPELPILFVTEWTDDVTDRNTSWPCYCLSKPFTAHVLTEVARRLVLGLSLDG